MTLKDAPEGSEPDIVDLLEDDEDITESEDALAKWKWLEAMDRSQERSPRGCFITRADVCRVLHRLHMLEFSGIEDKARIQCIIKRGSPMKNGRW